LGKEKNMGKEKVDLGVINQGGMRWDSYPSSGGALGSDPDVMKEQLLCIYNYAYAILTGFGYHVNAISDQDYDWHCVATEEEITPGKAKLVTVGNKHIGVL
jgi:hypothetical protein